MVGYFADFGKQIKKILPKKREKQKASQNKPTAAQIDKLLDDAASSGGSKTSDVNRHGVFFGVVYANDLAKAEFEKETPNFAVGSIIVREKNVFLTSEVPEIVIAMVKREKGFSADTGDWEFFTFNGADLKMQKRETKGDCAACHSRADKSDWIFRNYLK